MKHRSLLGTLLVALASLFIVIPGCRCNGHNTVGANDSTDTAAKEKPDSFSIEGISQKDSAKILANAPVAKALAKVLPSPHPDWKRFKLIDFNQPLDSSTTVSFHKDNSFYQKYAAFLKASPDQKYWIDMGTDNLVEDPGTHTIMTGDPEGQLYLIDRNLGTRTELVNLGGSGNLLEANWLDAEELSILCTMPGRNPKKDDTYLYIFNVKDKQMRTYQLR